MTLAKVKEQDGMMLAKVKKQDGMMLAKMKETQVKLQLLYLYVQQSQCSIIMPRGSSGIFRV